MRKSIFVIALMSVASIAFAQNKTMSSSNPNATQIQGNTEINANASNMSANATGQNNKAKNAVGSIKGGTQIQGNTKINANAHNVSANAHGQGNKATNDVGTIGGK